jgi:nucleotide-binding universal stress UspA family protein
VSILEGNDVPGLLLQHVKERNTRMVVMAAHPRGVMERALLGSVADRLIREANVPVIVVPIRTRTEDRAFVHAAETGSGLVGAALRAARPVRRILVPLDDSPGALQTLRALQPAAESADEVLLFHVVVPTSFTGMETVATDDGRALPEAVREARDRLDELARRLRTDLPAPRAEVVKADDPAAAITAAAREHRADLIALSTRGEKGLKRAIFGSTTSDVLRNATTPVLVVTH